MDRIDVVARICLVRTWTAGTTEESTSAAESNFWVVCRVGLEVTFLGTIPKIRTKVSWSTMVAKAADHKKVL